MSRPERYLTTAEVAEILRRSPGTVREYVQSGRLKAYRPGGGRAPLVFDPIDVDEFRQRFTVDHWDRARQAERMVRGIFLAPHRGGRQSR